MMKILKIKNLNLKIHEKEILKNISLEIDEGETIGLIGESGSGKTILTKFILGILPEVAHFSYDNFELIPEVGAIFQNAFTSLNPTVKIGKQLQHLYISHYGNKKNWKEKIENLLEEVGLDNKKNFLDKYPHELSGGEQQRIVIMGALIGEPKFLIADEVTTALDIKTKIEIIKFFKKLQKKLKISILFITHDLTTLKEFADKIFIMYHGEIIDEKHPYRKQLFQLSQDIWRRKQ